MSFPATVMPCRKAGPSSHSNCDMLASISVKRVCLKDMPADIDVKRVCRKPTPQHHDST